MGRKAAKGRAIGRSTQAEGAEAVDSASETGRVGAWGAALAATVIVIVSAIAMGWSGEDDVGLKAAADVASMLRWRAAGRRAAAAKGMIAGGEDMPGVERRRYDPSNDGPVPGFLATVTASTAVPVVITGIPLAEAAAAVWAEPSNALLQAAAPALPGVYELPAPSYVYRERGLPLPGFDDGRRELVPAISLADYMAAADARAATPPDAGDTDGDGDGTAGPFLYFSRELRSPAIKRLAALLPQGVRQAGLSVARPKGNDNNNDGAGVDTVAVPQLWLAQPGVTTHAHYDVFDNFYLQLRGRKQFFLAGPDARSALPVFPVTHEQTRQVRFDPRKHRDAGRATAVDAAADAREAVLAPGELLYIPAYTFHQVHPLTFSASVNTFSPTHFTDVFAELRSAGIPRPLMQLDSTVEGSRRRVAILAHFARSVLRQAWELGTADAIRGFVLAELAPRYLELEGPAGCVISASDAHCPAGPALRHVEVTEVNAVAGNVAGALHGFGGPVKEGYTDSVLRLLTANYIEDLSNAVLGAPKVCLFLRCLATEGAWASSN